MQRSQTMEKVEMRLRMEEEAKESDGVEWRGWREGDNGDGGE